MYWGAKISFSIDELEELDLFPIFSRLSGTSSNRRKPSSTAPVCCINKASCDPAKAAVIYLLILKDRVQGNTSFQLTACACGCRPPSRSRLKKWPAKFARQSPLTGKLSVDAPASAVIYDSINNIRNARLFSPRAPLRPTNL